MRLKKLRLFFVFFVFMSALSFGTTVDSPVDIDIKTCRSGESNDPAFCVNLTSRLNKKIEVAKIKIKKTERSPGPKEVTVREDIFCGCGVKQCENDLVLDDKHKEYTVVWNGLDSDCKSTGDGVYTVVVIRADPITGIENILNMWSFQIQEGVLLETLAEN